MVIETIATAAITSRISKTGLLAPYINSGDKEPDWDGAIYVYKTPGRHSNLNFYGRVQTQVKGLSKSNLSKDTINYNIKVNSLKHYYDDGGIIYFVVYVDQNSNEKIYYKPLLRYDLSILLSQHSKEKKRIPVTLSLFPSNKEDIELIFLNFVHNQKKQGAIDENLLSVKNLNEIITEEKIESFNVSCCSLPGNNNPYDTLFNIGSYLYIKPKEFNLNIPIDHMPPLYCMSQDVEEEVYIDNKCFYNRYRKIMKKDSLEFYLGRSIILTACNSGKANIEFSLKGTIDERINDLEFMLAMINADAIVISGVKYYGLAINKINNFDFYQNCENFLVNCKAVKSRLKTLGNQLSLDCDILLDYDFKTLGLIMSENGVSFSSDYEIPESTIIDMGNLHMMVSLAKITEHTYEIQNYFTNTEFQKIENSSTKNLFEISKFALLKKDHFTRLTNINYEIIYDEITDSNINIEEDYINHVNILLLNMLNAYDKGTYFQDELLSAATRIAEWIMHQQFDLIHKINYIQCIKRQRNLTKEEKHDLYDIIDQSNQNTEILFACYLLLDNVDAANIYFDKLTDEIQDTYKEYPIYNFFSVK